VSPPVAAVGSCTTIPVPVWLSSASSIIRCFQGGSIKVQVLPLTLFSNVGHRVFQFAFHILATPVPIAGKPAAVCGARWLIVNVIACSGFLLDESSYKSAPSSTNVEPELSGLITVYEELPHLIFVYRCRLREYQNVLDQWAVLHQKSVRGVRAPSNAAAN